MRRKIIRDSAISRSAAHPSGTSIHARTGQLPAGWRWIMALCVDSAGLLAVIAASKSVARSKGV
jgi:hypothetical protein